MMQISKRKCFFHKIFFFVGCNLKLHEGFAILTFIVFAYLYFLKLSLEIKERENDYDFQKIRLC